MSSAAWGGPATRRKRDPSGVAGVTAGGFAPIPDVSGAVAPEPRRRRIGNPARGSVAQRRHGGVTSGTYTPTPGHYAQRCATSPPSHHKRRRCLHGRWVSVLQETNLSLAVQRPCATCLQSGGGRIFGGANWKPGGLAVWNTPQDGVVVLLRWGLARRACNAPQEQGVGHSCVPVVALH